VTATAPPSDPARDRALLRWFAGAHVRPHLPWLGLAGLLMALDGAMTGVISLLLQPMFDQVLVGGSRAAAVWVALAIAAVFVTRAVSSLVYKTLVVRVAERVVAGLQLDLTRHLMRLDGAFHHTHPPGHLIDRVKGDTAEVQAVFLTLMPGVARDLIAVVVLVGVALWTDVVWTLVTLIGLPLLVLPVLALQRLVRRMGIRAREASAAAATRLDEVFHGIVTIQRSRLERREEGRLAAALKGFVRARTRTAAGQAAMGSAADLVGAMGIALVLVWASGQIAGGERTVGQFMTFFAAIAFLFEPLRRLASLSGVWQQVLASLDRIRGLLDVAPTITQPSPPLAPMPRDMTIRFEGVVFGYGAEPVLRGLDLLAPAGRTTALVGPSGAGKSTVFTLLTRLADPQAGRITLGGQDIARLDLGGLRDCFAVVAQDAALFDETLRDNILLGADIPESRLRAAIEAACIDEFLPDLPQGLETRVGPRGSALSGGQRQRVAIARALVRDAPVLLLDEATSALDARSEALVQAALARLSAGRTTLVIAHRLATVQAADRILVLDRGRVAEAGSHAELLARGGLYAGLHALQFRAGG
jgi:ABC-type multidrug transport system fused ATPase/permease subunit